MANFKKGSIPKLLYLAGLVIIFGTHIILLNNANIGITLGVEQTKTHSILNIFAGVFVVFFAGRKR